MMRGIQNARRTRGSGVSGGDGSSGDESVAGFDAQTLEAQREEGRLEAAASGASADAAPPREPRREEPAKSQPRPRPLAGFAANRPTVQLAPEVLESAQRAFEEARRSLHLRHDVERAPRQEERGDGLEEKVRERELDFYWHNLLDFVPGGDDLPDSSGSTDSASGRLDETKKKWTKRSAKIHVMQTVLRTVDLLNPDERREFFEANGIEK